MSGHHRRRATQRSPTTPISPKGGGGTAPISLSLLLPDAQGHRVVVASRIRRRRARHKRTVFMERGTKVMPIKTGAARIALKAESAGDFKLDLTIVPVGLQFEPRRRFRADTFVRFGTPFKIADLAPLHAENPRQAVRELTGSIDTALKALAFHVLTQEHLPLVKRIADVYYQRVQQTGIAGVDQKGVRGELLYRTADCLNYYTEADPAAIKEIERKLERYERLREKAGVDRQLLEDASGLLPGPLAPLQVMLEALLGAMPALFGFLTGAIPYYLTQVAGRRVAVRTGHAPIISLTHILGGAIAFPLVYGLEIGWIWGHASPSTTLVFTLLLIPTGLFTRFYARRMWRWSRHLGGRIESWMKLDAVVRVAQARDDLLLGLDQMRDRYRVEVLGWTALPSRLPAPPNLAFSAPLVVTLILFTILGMQLRC